MAFMVAFWCLGCCSWGAAAGTSISEPSQMETQRLVSTSKLLELEQTNGQLLMRLENLQQQVRMLKTPSAQLVQELNLCRAELTEVSSSLAKAQQALILSQQDLLIAKSSLEKASSSLESLKAQIDAERAQAAAVQRRLRWQRALGWIGGCLLGACVGAAVS